MPPFTIVWPFYNHRQTSLQSLYLSITTTTKHVPHNNIIVVGDANKHPTIPSPRKKAGNFGKWYSYTECFQKLIDSPLVTDDFLYTSDDTFFLAPTTIKEFYKPDFDPGASIVWKKVQEFSLELLPPETRRNHSTHYPYFINKAKLQHIIDNYKQPYLIEMIYMNLFCTNPVPIDCTYMFSREVAPTIPPEVEVINVKQFTLPIRRMIECTL